MNTMKVKNRHQFAEDPAMRDARTGQQWCVCGLPADNAIHRLPDRSEDEREQERRRMGESE